MLKREQLLWGLAAFGATAAMPTQQSMAETATRPTLRFTEDGKFQIAVFEDLHFGEGPETEWGPDHDQKTLGVMNTILDLETPQLVVLNGDLVTGENTFLENSTDYIDMIAKPLMNHNVPWASAYGNHDIQYNLSTDSILKRERTYLLSLTQKMVFTENGGVSNYYLPVYPSASYGGDDIPALLLWFFDSKGGLAFQERKENGDFKGVPGVTDSTVAEWFSSTNAALTKQHGKVVPSLAFVHIPTYASNRFQLQGVDPNKEPGINDDYLLAHQAIQCPNGECEYDGTDIPFMTSLVQTEGLMAVFSGHDHGVDWCAKWNSKLPDMSLVGSGLNLCFGRHTGYGGYGDWTRGSRQIVVNEQTLQEREIETWNRLENAKISGLVTLNSTYGVDKYPAVENTDARTQGGRDLESTNIQINLWR